MAVIDTLIEKLKAAGLFAATARRHQLHVETCERLGAQPEKFETFATEALNGVENDRVETVKDMLRIGPEVYPPYQAPVRYRQYDTPTGTEMLAGLSPRKK